VSAPEQPVVHRINLRFSASGRYSTSVVADACGRFALQAWELGSAGPRHRFSVDVPDLVATVGLPLEDGRTVLVEHGPDAHRLTVLDPAGSAGPAPIRVAPCRLLPPPAGGGTLAVGLRHQASRSLVLLVEPDGVTELAAVKGPPVRAWPAGENSLVLAGAAGPAGLLDLRTGRLDRLPAELVPDGTVLLDATAGRFLLAAQGNAGSRLFVGSLSAPPRALSLPDAAGRATPVAVAPAGDQAALVVEHGAAGSLLLAGADGSRPVRPGLASLTPAAAWTEHGLWGTGSAPDRPPGYYWLPSGDSSVRWSTAAEDGPPARLVTVPGAAGELEAIGYGPDWRTAERVVLAVHGGPRDHWRAAYEPVLRMLAATGACVLAVNQRGSTGYGRDFELAVKGCWGGPDLADLRAVAAWLRRSGAGLPALWGTSYGGYLALLAAAAEPDGWAGCVAISPFASAASLDAVAGPQVRALIARLDGCHPVADDLGERDLVRLAGRIRCPTLIAHGALDRTIPVEQSRAIVSAMKGSPAGTLLRYLELPDRDHAVLRAAPGDPVLHAAFDLLADQLARA